VGEVYILIDTIQHFTPEQIAFMIGDGEKLYSVQYEYRAKRGGHHVLPGGLPEVRWERDHQGLWVEDRQHTARYRKDPADWTRPGGCKVGDDTLAWNVVTTVGDCQIIQFHLVRAELAEVRDKDPMNDSYYGNVTPDMIGLHDPRETELWPIMSTITNIYSAEDNFFCTTHDSEVLVPKQGVGHIALWAAGKKREERTYADACIQARQWLKTARLTTIEKADSIPYIVSFGLLRNLEAESKAMDCLAFHAGAVAVHNARVADPFAPSMTERGRQMVIWAAKNKWWLAPTTAAITATAIFALSLFTKGKVQGALQNWLLLATKYNAWVVENAKTNAKIAKANLLETVVDVSRQAWSYLSTASHSRTCGVAVASGMIAFLAVLKLLRRIPQPRVAGPLITYCARNRPLKPMREGAKCKVDDDALCSQEDCIATEGPFHIGLGILNHIPALARHCVHNDLVAVRNRGICERGEAQQGWWSTTGRRRMFRLFGELGPVIPTKRPEWKERFPGKQRRDLDKAEEDDTSADAYNSGTRKAFTKSECAEKRSEPTDDEPWGRIEDYDPRLIQGCQLEYVNATGPFAHALSKACKGEHGDTTYGPGLNALALDKWLTDAENSFEEEVAYLDSDAVRLDASVCVECITVETDLYVHLGAPEEAVAMFRADTVTHGHTSKGVSYSVPGTVPSGKTTTTVGNTIAVITTVEEALRGIKHKAIVAGDDAAILVPARLAIEARDALMSVGKRAGFELKVKASRFRYDMEFCSGRWWPAATTSGFAFGPKPGKLLPKLFFANTRNACGTAQDAYLNAICVGMGPNVQHLPVAREYIQQVFALTDHVWGPGGSKMIKSGVRERLERSFRVQRGMPVQQSPEIWEAYAHIYGLSQQECMDAVEKIREVEILPNLLQHHVYDAFVEQDAPAVEDPKDRDPDLLAQGSVLGYLLGGATWASPFLEELLRSRFPKAFTIGVTVFEFLAWKNAGGAAVGYIPAAAVNMLSGCLQYGGYFKTAVCVHYLFNAAVNIRNRSSAPVANSFVALRKACAGSGRRPTSSYESCLVNIGRERLSSCNLAAKFVENYSLSTTLKHNINCPCDKMSYTALPQRQRPPRVPRRPKTRQGGKPKPPPVPRRGQAVQQYKARRFRARAARQRNRGGGTRRNPMAGNVFPAGNNSRPKRTCFVENDEYIGEILGSNSTTPVIATFPVNPGQSKTFPWLSEQALQWEKYHFDYLEFYYKPEVSGFATEGQSGKVVFMMDYDASDPAPTTKQEMEDTDPHVDGMPYEDIMLSLDPYEMFTDSDAKYVRPFGLPGGADIKTYDCGNFNVATINNGGTNAVGELHVRYGVSFSVPILEATKSNAPANNQVAWFQSTGSEAGAANSTPYTMLFAVDTTNGIGAVNTAGSIVLPAGNYLIDVDVVGTQSIAADALAVEVDIQLGGMSILGNGNHGGSLYPTAASVSGPFPSVHVSAYISVNGSQALTVVEESIYSAGAPTLGGSIRIVAV
jgi:hypothetical protein